jgi:hypothetical protein
MEKKPLNGSKHKLSKCFNIRELDNQKIKTMFSRAANVQIIFVNRLSSN